jgi:hypothetical protein
VPAGTRGHQGAQGAAGGSVHVRRAGVLSMSIAHRIGLMELRAAVKKPEQVAAVDHVIRWAELAWPVVLAATAWRDAVTSDLDDSRERVALLDAALAWDKANGLANAGGANA